MAERRTNTKRGDSRGQDREQDVEQKIIDLARVTRVMAGGKRMRFRACVVVGDRKGSLGYAIAKGADVAMAVNKAVAKAKRTMTPITIENGTIRHTVKVKYKAAHLLMKPAPEGTGVVAGGAVRAALEISGVDNIVAKMFGSKNKINNIKALFAALDVLRNPSVVAQPARGNKKKSAPAAEAVEVAVEKAAE